VTWFKVDDSFYDHPKVFDAPDCAMALWTRAGCWAARNLTDGFVPSGMPARLCDDPDTAVKELVRRKLWLRVKDGYRFHDWVRYQPTRESVHHERDAATERKRKERERRKLEKEQVKPPSVTDMSHRDTPVIPPVTHGGVTAPRPDPTRPEVLAEPLFEDPPPEGGEKTPTQKRKQSAEAEAPEPSAKEVVAAYIDGARTKRRTVPGEVVKQVGAAAKRLLEKDKIPHEELVAAAFQMGERGWKDLNMQLLKGADNNTQPRSGARNQHVPYQDPEDTQRYKTSTLYPEGSPQR
jgi:hypothetical protein